MENKAVSAEEKNPDKKRQKINMINSGVSKVKYLPYQ